MNKTEISRVIYSPPAPQAFDMALADRFVQFIDARARTIQEYSKAINRFLHYLQDRGIVQPQRADVLAYRAELMATLRPSSVQFHIVALRQFFRWTAQEGLYPNIADNIKGAKQDNTFKKDPLTSMQVSTVLNAIDRDTPKGARDYAMLFLMVTTGIRCIEVARANVEDFRPCGDTMVLYVQGKGHDERSDYVKVEPPVETAIRDYMAFALPSAKDRQPLFVSLSNHNNSMRMTTRSISRVAKERMRAAGLNSSRLTAHSLRHTAGTLALMNGATLEETKDLLRHSRLDTTMIYSHHIERAKNNSESKICQAIMRGLA